MKIVYVITKSNFGGAQRYVLDLAKYGKKEGHGVSVITGGDGSLIGKLREEDVSVHRLPYLSRDINLIDEIRSFKDIYKILQREGPDVIHVNSSKTGGLGALAGRIYNLLDASSKARIIFTAHGWPFNELRALWARGLIWFFSWLTVILSHKTIVVTAHDYRQGQKMPFAGKKIVLIPNGVETFELEAREFAREKLASHKKDGLWVGYVGELHNLNKGVNYLVEAFAYVSKKHPEATLVIVGEGTDRKVLDELVMSFSLEDKVIFSGHINDARTLLKAFDIFTLPSLKEGLPYVLLEAGMAGLATVATEIGGIPDIIENNRSGFMVSPKNPDVFSQKLLSLSKNTALRKFMGQNLHRKITRYFGAEEMKEKTFKLYA